MRGIILKSVKFTEVCMVPAIHVHFVQMSINVASFDFSTKIKSRRDFAKATQRLGVLF